MKASFEAGSLNYADLEDEGVLPNLNNLYDEAVEQARNIKLVQMEPDPALAMTLFAGVMQALGLDPNDPHLAGTPLRVINMYMDVLRPESHEFSFTTFASEGAGDQMVSVGSIPFSSFCAHHLLPFTGVAHIAYIPGELLAGLSKFARAMQYFSAKPQVQERLGVEVADFLEAVLLPKGVAITIDARHSCMELRGPRATGAVTRTTVLRGAFKDNDATRAEYFAQVPERLS